MNPVDNPEIGIVVPVFNRAASVGVTLDSILGQTYRPINLVIVDNNSSDASRQTVEEWADAHSSNNFRVSVVTESKPGAAAARNRGLAELDAPYVMFFDSDDVMYPSLVVSAVDEFVKNPDLDLVYWRHVISGGKRSRFTRTDLLEYHLIHCLLNTSAYMARRSTFLNAGGWNESLHVWDDFELGLRVLLTNPKTRGIDRVLYEVTSHEDSISGISFSPKRGAWEKTLNVMEREISECHSPEKSRMLKMIEYRRAILAAHYDRETGDSTVTIPSSLPLRFAYRYTRLGGRGAWSILKLLSLV